LNLNRARELTYVRSLRWRESAADGEAEVPLWAPNQILILPWTWIRVVSWEMPKGISNTRRGGSRPEERPSPASLAPNQILIPEKTWHIAKFFRIEYSLELHTALSFWAAPPCEAGSTLGVSQNPAMSMDSCIRRNDTNITLFK